MTRESKRALRATIAHLKTKLEQFEEAHLGAHQAARDAIRVLNLTAYIEHRESYTSSDIIPHYDVDQFLDDIEAGVAELNERDRSRAAAEALHRLGRNETAEEAAA